jgi:hypothetical protein
VQFNAFERDLLNSGPVQRLRGIKQLALAGLLYPGAVHTRFEHSLGVMELAGRAFDAVSLEAAAEVKETLGWHDEAERVRQRQLIRVAALLHDVGHPPFSHAAEGQLSTRSGRGVRPGDRGTHEHYTHDLIAAPSGEVRQIIEEQHYRLGIKVEDVLRVAVPDQLPKAGGRAFHEVLAALVTGELGVDRIDYLVRDSHHAGVAYGRFDHLRLLNTLRVVQPPEPGQPVLALQKGGVHTAESLILARHFMFTEVYQHRVRQIYDLHLGEYLDGWLPGGRFPASLDEYLALDDAVVEAAYRADARNPLSPRHALASRLTGRRHFRMAAAVLPAHRRASPGLFPRIQREITAAFGPEAVRFTELRTRKASLASLQVVDGDQIRPITDFSNVFLAIKQEWEGRIYADPLVSGLRARVHQFCERRLPKPRRSGEDEPSDRPEPPDRPVPIPIRPLLDPE